MKRIQAIIVGLIVVVGVACGQSGSAGTSIYSVLFTNATSNASSANVTNIGQVAHSATLYLANKPGQTCTVPNYTSGSFQFSYDNVNWTNFGTNEGGSSLSYTPSLSSGVSYYAQGSYPYVRFQLGVLDGTHCVVNGYYTGSSNAGGITSSYISPGTYFGGEYYINGHQFFPYTANVAGILSDGKVSGLNVCNLTTNVTLGIGNTLIPGVATSTINGIEACSLYLSSSAASTVYLFWSTTNDCATPVGSHYFTTYLAGNQTVTFGPGVGPIMLVGNTGAFLCANSTAAAYITLNTTTF